MKSNKRKGFTLVELLVVIAILAALATVGVIGFMSFKRKANNEADSSIVAQLNIYSEAYRQSEKAMSVNDLSKSLKKDGFDLEKLVCKNPDNTIAYDTTGKKFFLIDKDGSPKDYDLAYRVDGFAFVNVFENISVFEGYGYSTYLQEGNFPTIINCTKGIDVGYNSEIQKINYTSIVEQNVTIRTLGGTLNVNDLNEGSHQTHYGMLDRCTVNTGESCFITHGTIQYMRLENGKVIADENGVIYLMEANAETATAEERGGIFIIPQGATIEEIKTPISKLPAGYTVEGGVIIQPANISNKIAENQGLLGSGTENDPFQIYNYDTFQAVSTFYNVGYKYFKVNKELTINWNKEHNNDSSFEIDCSNWVPVLIYGSFDGTGVILNNVTNSLFDNVGKGGAAYASTIDLKNFSANMNASTAYGNAQGSVSLCRDIYNFGTTNFTNVQVHGYLEGDWNMGSFFNYGTAQVDVIGADYTVNMTNCISDATLVCTTGNGVGGLIGHPYPGEGHKLTLNLENTYYIGLSYTTNKEVHSVFAAFEGFANCNVANTYLSNAQRLSISDLSPTHEETAYQVAKASNAKSIVVKLVCCLTAYDQDGQPLVNNGGITMSLTHLEIDNPEEINNILDLFTSVEVINDSSYDLYDSKVENGVLKIYTGSNKAYLTGEIALIASQYSSTGNIVATGDYKIASKGLITDSWTIR